MIFFFSIELEKNNVSSKLIFLSNKGSFNSLSEKNNTLQVEKHALGMFVTFRYNTSCDGTGLPENNNVEIHNH